MTADLTPALRRDAWQKAGLRGGQGRSGSDCDDAAVTLALALLACVVLACLIAAVVAWA